MNVTTFKLFIKQVIKEDDGAVTMFVDNLRVHHVKCLEVWLKEHKVKDSFTLEYLLSNSRELNLDGYLNQDVKARLAEQSLPANLKVVCAAVTEHLSERKWSSEKLRNLFKKPEVRYTENDSVADG